VHGCWVNAAACFMGMLASQVSGRGLELASLMCWQRVVEPTASSTSCRIPASFPPKAHSHCMWTSSIRVAAGIVGVIRHVIPRVDVAAGARQLGGVRGLLLLGALLQAAPPGS
jgi:hypothetical protein